MRPRLSTVCAYCITVNWRTCDSVTLIERQPRQAAMSEPPLVIDVVDNGGQWTHREWRMLRYLGVDTQIIENTTPVSEVRELDGLILSGGAARVGLTGELGNRSLSRVGHPNIGHLCRTSIHGRLLWGICSGSS